MKDENYGKSLTFSIHIYGQGKFDYFVTVGNYHVTDPERVFGNYTCLIQSVQERLP